MTVIQTTGKVQVGWLQSHALPAIAHCAVSDRSVVDADRLRIRLLLKFCTQFANFFTDSMLYCCSWFLTTRAAVWSIILVVSVCPPDDNFRKPSSRGSSYCTCGIHPQSTGRVRIWRWSGQDQGYRSQKGRKFLFPQCKTSIGNNSRSIKHKATMFACSMGFSGTADRMV